MKILVFQPHHLGDIILATPALQVLRTTLPEAKIHLVTGSWNKTYVESFPFVDKIIYFDIPSSKRGTKQNIISALSETIRFVREIRKTEYDYLLDFTGERPSHKYIPFIKAKNKFGQIRCLRYTQFIKKLNPKINIPHYYWVISKLIFDKRTFSKDGITEIKRDLDVVNLLINKRYKIPPLWYPATHKEEKEIAKMLNRKDIKNFIVIHPVTPWKPREWPKERFARVADWIVERKKMEVIFIGISEEKEDINKIISLMTVKQRQKIHNFAGVVNIKQLAALLKRATLFVGNDSGVAHLAAITKTPAVVIFGPGDEKRWGHEYQSIVKKSINCSPCSQNIAKNKCHLGKKTCESLEKLSQQEVINTIRTVFKNIDSKEKLKIHSCARHSA